MKGLIHMKLSKLLLAVVGATVLLGAFVSSASARNLSVSSRSNRASWSRFEFTGGFGIIECEVVLEGTYHATTSVKSVGSLLGYITAGNVTACARGGATVNRESLPWHRRYRGFAGELPLIRHLIEQVIGAEFRLRDSATGATCNVRRETSSMIFTYELSAGTVALAGVSSFSRCRGGIITLEGEIRGSTTNVDDRSGNRITVTLI
jgi:hypothetical protein